LQRGLSVSYERVGNVQKNQVDLPGALKSYRDSLGIREKLAKQDPGNAGWQRDLSVSYDNVGDGIIILERPESIVILHDVARPYVRVSPDKPPRLG
jgi:hypothetical protein